MASCCLTPLVIRGPRGFPGLGGSGVLSNFFLEVQKSYSPGTPMENYQFTDLQEAINYGETLASSDIFQSVLIKVYPGIWSGEYTLPEGVSIEGSGVFLTRIDSIIINSPNAKKQTNILMFIYKV